MLTCWGWMLLGTRVWGCLGGKRGMARFKYWMREHCQGTRSICQGYCESALVVHENSALAVSLTNYSVSTQKTCEYIALWTTCRWPILPFIFISIPSTAWSSTMVAKTGDTDVSMELSTQKDHGKHVLRPPCPETEPTNTLPEPLHITTLPAETHLRIFDFLSPESSACLGLTCKKFYPLFFARDAKTPLRRLCDECGWNITFCRWTLEFTTIPGSSKCRNSDGAMWTLGELLRGWIPDDDHSL